MTSRGKGHEPKSGRADNGRSIERNTARHIVDAMREPVFLVSLDGRILAWNQAAADLTGTHQEDIADRRLFDTVPRVVTEKHWRAAVHKLQRRSDRRSLELPNFQIELEQGHDVTLSPTMGLIETPGEPTIVILTLRDVTTLRRYQNNLRALTERLIETEERERLRISRYVHDMIIQNLSLSRIKLAPVVRRLSGGDGEQDVETLRKVQELVDETIDQCRSVMSDLTPPLLYEVGLRAALEELSTKLTSQHDIPIHIADNGLPDNLPNPVRSLLFQAARELVWNALKHAGPCEIHVRLETHQTHYRIIVEDDGRGFDLDTVELHTSRGLSFGLFNIRERLDGLGGSLDIRTRPGDGTIAVMVLPHSVRQTD